MTKRTKYLVIDDSELAIPVFSSICTYCAHWDVASLRQCAAYPSHKAIPMSIWMGEELHIVPRGDEEKDSSERPIIFTPHPEARTLPDELQAFAQRDH